MEEKKIRDVTEALEIFDRLTDEQKQDALAFLRTLQQNNEKGVA